jgi:hypothetical protein
MKEQPFVSKSSLIVIVGRYLTHFSNTAIMFKKLLLILLLLSISNFSYSQISISYPVVRQIFQRDLNNQAVITITGSYSQPIDTVQVRFTPVKSGQGTAIDWTVIKSSPLGGLFKGAVTVKGGWYTMEVRGTLNGKTVGNTTSLERVGVGEVFVIAGQSNAGGSGNLETNETAASDDRVNCANFISPRTYFPTYPSLHADVSQFGITVFNRLTKNSAIAPMGLGPYYWGKVGDALVAKLNVPVMFFNTAWGGSSLKSWRESAENPTVSLPFEYVANQPYPAGYPYANLNAVLRYYGINLGVRAVLWMEGETHNAFNLAAIAQKKPLPTTTDSYLSDITKLIKKSRQDLGTNKLTWVVGRTSYSSFAGAANCASSASSPEIVAAQNKAIADPNLNPMFPGPESDRIQTARVGERSDCIHFTGGGLDDIANSWFKIFTDKNSDNKDFFDVVEPIVADTIPSVTLDCISSNTLKLSLPAGYSAYEWVNADNGDIIGRSSNVVVGTGSYAGRVTRSNGNVVQVPVVSVRANTPPNAPIVTALSDVNFCIGTSVTLKSSTEVESPIYDWNSNPVIGNISRQKDIAATREATYKLRVIDKNACVSPYSSEVKLVAKPRPETPTIATSGSTEFCDGQSIVLTSTNVGASSYLWSNGENTQTITVKKSGSFFVQTRSANGCLSPSSKDNISVVVNPLPTTPQIVSKGDTVFCEGNSVMLELSTNEKKYGWNRNNAVNNSDNLTTIRISGTELVRGFVTDSKNCISKLSNAIQVVKKDVPKMSVFQKGPYTLVARSNVSNDEYIWKIDGQLKSSLRDSTVAGIKEGEGSYTVFGRKKYVVKSSSNPLTCVSAESDPYQYKIYDDKGLSIYPNPSLNGLFTLETRYPDNKSIVSVYSIDGRLVFEKLSVNFNNPVLIDLSTLTVGMYVLKVGSKNDISKDDISKYIYITR